MKILLFLMLILKYSSADLNEVPVIITDEGHITSKYDIQSNPFVKITSSHFTDLVHEVLINTNPVIIFVEDQLSSEDITSKDEFGTPYSYLNRNLKKKNLKYLPAVTHPMRILTQMFPPLPSNVFYIYSAANLDLTTPFKYIYVRFIDKPGSINQTRVDKLRDHDSLIKEIYLRTNQARSASPIVTFYTGKRNPITIEKLYYRYTKVPDNNDDRIVVSENALFRLAGIYSISPLRARLVRYTHEPTIAAEKRHGSQYMSTAVSYSDFELRFNFKFSRSGWTLDNVALYEGDEEVGRTAMNVGAPWNFSFVCAEPITLINTRDSSSITISKYQIEVLRAKGDPNTSFGNKVVCGPYFNSQILAGLFVVGILLSICFTGIVLLMNCNSNDRFDNPQGKEIITKVDVG